MSKSLVKRRSLLKALGGASFLAAPVFRATLAEAQAAPLRLIILVFPGGAMMSGTDPGIFTYDQMLSSLAPLSSDLLLLHNLVDAKIVGGIDPGHSGVRVMLTGEGRGVSEDTTGPIPPGLSSIDQVIAQSVGKNTKFASLEFGVASFSAPSESGDATTMIYSNGTPVQAVEDPATMFTRLFGGGVPTPGPAPTGSTSQDAAALAQLQAIAAQRRSMLDILKGQVTDIQGLVGSAEKLRLDEHLAALRELEKQIMDPSTGTGGGPVASPGTTCGAPTLGSGTDFPAVTAAMSELLYQAINCDSTRVATLQLLTSGNQMRFTWLGQNIAHHEMQHMPGPELVTAQTWLMSQFAAIIKRLKDTPEGAGSLLDNSLVYVTSELGDGSGHANHPVPVLLAGKAGGQLRTGRTLDLGGKNRTNLSLNLANLMGVPLTTFGDPASVTGPLSLG